MVTELLMRSGLSLGDHSDLVPASYANEAGYWENLQFVRLNELVLAAASGAWDNPPEFPSASARAWRKDGSFGQLIDRAKKLVGTLSLEGTWGWKDPRNSIALPFWLKVMPSLKIVICVRNPLEVAISLQRIGAVPSNASGLRLWKRYSEHVLSSAPSSQRILTHYEQYFAEPVHEIRRLAAFAGLTLNETTAQAVVDTIRFDLRHSDFGDKDLAGFGADAELVDLYARMCDEAGWRPESFKIASKRPAKDANGSRSGLAEVTQLKEELRNLRLQAEELQSRLEQERALVSAGREQALRLQDEAYGARYDLEEARATGRSETTGYRRELRRIREIVRDKVSRDATITVLSGGDENLLKLFGRKARHFPHDLDGSYVDCVPSSSTAAIAQLELARSMGADYLLIPSSELWWLDQFRPFDRYLRHWYRAVVTDEEGCFLFGLSADASGAAHLMWHDLDSALTTLETSSDHDVAVLDWDSGAHLDSYFPDHRVFSPLMSAEILPYLDGSIEVVAFRQQSSATRTTEARRVASVAVVACSESETEVPSIVWKARPVTELPKVSLVVSGRNGDGWAYKSFESLRASLPSRLDCEIILITDGEGSAVFKASVRTDPRVRELRRRPGKTTPGEWNRAAATATGDVLIFIDGSTVFVHGWAEPLIKTVSTQANAGVVGAKLLALDGKLWHAGGVVFSDGTVARIGDSDEEVEAPSYSFARSVDFCFPTMLATPRPLFARVGGFHDTFPFGSFLSADYSLRIGKLGYLTYYQPDSVGLVLESAKEDSTHTVFAKRWRSRLRRQPTRPPRLEGSIWQTLPFGGNGQVLGES